MRLRVQLSALLLALSSRAWAHIDAEELGHHWAVPAYTQEMRFQVLLMALAIVVITIGRLLLWVWRRRSAQQ